MRKLLKCENNANVSGVCIFPQSEFNLGVTNVKETVKFALKVVFLIPEIEVYLDNQMSEWIYNDI